MKSTTVAIMAVAFAWAGIRFLSQSSGAGLITNLDVVYGQAGGEPLKVDLYRPASMAHSLPAVLFVHGGGWIGGSKSDFADLAKGMAKRGYVCASADYRLVRGTTNRFPAALDDLQLCVRWLRFQASRYGIHPGKIGAAGASAGGQLVALLGLTDTARSEELAHGSYSSQVQCVVDLFGPADLSVDLRSDGETNAVELVRALIGKPRAEAPELYRAASPITYVKPGAPPFLILHGVDDPIVPIEQSRRLADALRKSGGQVTLIEYPQEGHGFHRHESVEDFIQRTPLFLDACLR